MLLTPQQARHLHEYASTSGFAILAVNADSPAAITDCLIAASNTDAPIIVETSLWQLTGHSFGAGDPFLGVDRYLSEIRTLAESDRFKPIPILYHTDHIKGEATKAILQHAMLQGASSISLDSSELDNPTNVELVCELCAFAAQKGIDLTLEMEAGVDDGVTTLDETKALFGEVEKRRAGYLSMWAPGVGTQHGLQGENRCSPEAIRQHQRYVSEEAGRPIGIALHGSSGLSDQQLANAVEAGVAKVNWSSESLLFRSSTLREYYRQVGDQLNKAHPDFKKTAMDNGPQSYVSNHYVPLVENRIRVLGGEGQATKWRATLTQSDD